MMKQVMKRAWELAKKGVKNFGGKVREYLSSSLVIAWEEIKNMKTVTATFVKNDIEVFVKHLGNFKVECTANGITTIARAEFVRNTYCYSFENNSDFIKQFNVSLPSKEVLIASDTAKIFRDLSQKESEERVDLEIKKAHAVYIEKAKKSENGLYVLEHTFRTTSSGLVEFIRTIDVDGNIEEETIKHH